MKAAIVAVIVLLAAGYAYHVWTGRQISEHEKARLEAQAEAERLQEIYEQEREERLADYERYRDRTARINRELADARKRESELADRLRQASTEVDQAETDLDQAVTEPIPESAEQLAADTIDLWHRLYGERGMAVQPLPISFDLNRPAMELAYLSARELVASRDLIPKLRGENEALEEYAANKAEQIALLDEQVKIGNQVLDQCLNETENCRAYTQALEKQLRHTEDELQAVRNRSTFNLFRPKIQAGGGLCVTANGMGPCVYVGIGWGF